MQHEDGSDDDERQARALLGCAGVLLLIGVALLLVVVLVFIAHG